MKEKIERKSFELFFPPSAFILPPCFSAALTRWQQRITINNNPHAEFVQILAISRRKMDQKERNLKRLRELSEEIKSRLDYRSFYLRFCRDAHVNGARMQTLCPIPAHSHSGKGHQSLSVDLNRGLFHCFSRDEGGDAIRFYELMRGLTFSKAVREMATELGLTAGAQPSLAVRAAPDREIVEQEEPL